MFDTSHATDPPLPLLRTDACEQVMIGYPHLERPGEFVAAVVTFATV